MRVAVQCESPLLQRSLELFLDGHLSALKQCDVVIRDKRIDDDTRPTLLISSAADADLVKPFSRSQLMLALEQMIKMEDTVQQAAAVTQEKECTDTGKPMDFEILQKRIEMLTQEYQHNILKAVRAFYER